MIRESFLIKLQELGYVRGRSVEVDFWVEEQDHGTPLAAAEAMLASGAHLIVAESPQMVRTAMTATQTTPIVMLRTPLAVESGLVHSRARPGGNVTGVSRPTYAPKHLELLKEALPHVTRVAVPVYGSGAVEWPALQDAAVRLGVEVVRIDDPWARGIDVDAVLEEAVRQGCDALLPLGGSQADTTHRSLARLSTRYGLPSIFGRVQFAEGGGLLAFGGVATDQAGRAAVFVDRILRGSKAGELPLEEPTSYSLTVNLDTANQLGLTLPPSILGRATRLIGGPAAPAAPFAG